MKLPTKEKIILALAMFSAFIAFHFYLSYENVKRTNKHLEEMVQLSLEVDPMHHFLGNYGLAQLLENGDIDEAKYIALLRAKSNHEKIEPDKLRKNLYDNVQGFENFYIRVLEDLCNNDHFKACVSLGKEYVSFDKFDSAYEVLLKAAKNENYDAMFELYLLYQRKDWKGYSQSESKKWLLKTGK